LVPSSALPPPTSLQLRQICAVAVETTLVQAKELLQAGGASLAGVPGAIKSSTDRNGVFTHDVAVTVNSVCCVFGANAMLVCTTSVGLA